MDLLLLSEDGTHHYVLITDLEHVANFVKDKPSRSRDGLCRKCFHACSPLESLKDHKVKCYKSEAARNVLPKQRKKLHLFKSARATWFSPLVVYFHTESLLVPIHTCCPAPNASGQMKLGKYVPCGYAFVSVEHGNDNVLWYRSKREPNCLEDFIQELEKMAKYIHNRKQSHRFFRCQPLVPKESVNDCGICNKFLEEYQKKVLDHCRYSGTFLGCAHSQCNRKRKSTIFTSVIAHNKAGYDNHHICTIFNKNNANNRFSVIPTTDEKDISFTFSVWLNSFVDKNGVFKNVYENMRFFDSFKFMSESLEKLVGFLPKETFTFLESQMDMNKNTIKD